MDIDIINAKDTKFTDAVSLSFHGLEEAFFDLFHKVPIAIIFCLKMMVYAGSFLWWTMWGGLAQNGNMAWSQSRNATLFHSASLSAEK